MLSPKRCWELINRTRGFDIIVCDRLNKVLFKITWNQGAIPSSLILPLE